MTSTDAKHELEPQQLDAEHELPPPHDDELMESATGGQTVASAEASEELQKLRAERDALLDRLVRLQAELENSRKRAAKEQQEFREYALMDTVRSLLPVLDSLEQAPRHAENAEKFRSGVELIHRQLVDTLHKIGVQQIPTGSWTFDPRYQEAVEVVDTTDAKDGQVVEVLQHGYKLKDRLLRPAKVRVARTSNTQSQDGSGEGRRISRSA